jgi:hypothetical protein
VPDRVIVFIDYQNVFSTARNVFHPDETIRTPQDGHISPVAVSELLVVRRQRPSVLHEVRVYRGLPNATKEPGASAANNRQADAWSRDPRVNVFRRPLRYPSNWPTNSAQEKGIDVALAVDLVWLGSQAAYDVAILFSRDTDLVPALEAVISIPSPRLHVEVASWTGSSRLRFPDTNLPWCHTLRQEDYDDVKDRTNYLARRPHSS